MRQPGNLGPDMHHDRNFALVAQSLLCEAVPASDGNKSVRTMGYTQPYQGLAEHTVTVRWPPRRQRYACAGPA